jgi:hypothetical protein
MITAPFFAAKAITLIVPILYVWQNSATPGFPSHTELRQAFSYWDAQHYLDIASNGYGPTLDFHYGYWYGYPALVRGVSTFVRDDVVAGLMVSAVGELLALYFIARLVLRERDEPAARFSVWAIAMYPMAFFLTAIYTDSCFVAAAAACLYYARRGDQPRAVAAAVVASFMRAFGVLLIPVLLIEYLSRQRWRPGRWLPAFLLPTIPLLLYAIYCHYRVGDAFAYQHALENFLDYRSALPWHGAKTTWDQVVLSSASASTTYVFALELIFGIGGAVVITMAWLDRRFPVSFTVFMTLTWLASVSRSYWIGVPRYGMFLFPGVILFADRLRQRPSWRTGLVATSGGFMALGTAIYASGHWLG